MKKLTNMNHNTLLFIAFLSLCQLTLTAQDTLNVSPAIETTAIETLAVDTLETNIIINKTLSIMAVGDMMIGTDFPSTDYLSPDDGAEIFSAVQAQLSAADLTFGNLEGVILSGDYPTTKKCQNPKYCYAFKMPDRYVKHFKDAGFDLLSIANNHINDFGTLGIENTARLLGEAGIQFAGVTDYPHTIFEVNGLTIGFCAFSPNRGTVKSNNLSQAKQIVSELESKVDIVIVSFHGGGEGLDYQHITKETEYYLGENRGNPYQFARDMIDAGADVILGHGPHVTRAIDIYKNKFIAYSLGNFSTYGRFNLQGQKGISPMIKINVDEDGNFLDGEIISVKLIGGGIPVVDSKKQALSTIESLMASDLEDCGLVLKADGSISLKE